jgi:hypothetical protein
MVDCAVALMVCRKDSHDDPHDALAGSPGCARIAHGLYELRDLPDFIRTYPGIIITLALLTLAGSMVAILIRRTRHEEFPSIR